MYKRRGKHILKKERGRWVHKAVGEDEHSAEEAIKLLSDWDRQHREERRGENYQVKGEEDITPRQGPGKAVIKEAKRIFRG